MAEDFEEVGLVDPPVEAALVDQDDSRFWRNLFAGILTGTILIIVGMSLNAWIRMERYLAAGNGCSIEECSEIKGRLRFLESEEIEHDTEEQRFQHRIDRLERFLGNKGDFDDQHN